MPPTFLRTPPRMMALPLACPAQTTLLFLSISVQRDLKNILKILSGNFLPHVWVSLGVWSLVQDFQTLKEVVLPDCPKSTSPIYRGISHLWTSVHICEICMHSPRVCSTNSSLQQKLPTQASLHPRAKGFLIKTSL